MRLRNFYFFLIVVSMVYPIYNLESVYGMAPFSQFSLNDVERNDQVDSPNAEGDSVAIDNRPINISSLSYFGDGNYLNATLWLTHPIFAGRHGEYLNSSINYVMDIYNIRPDNRQITNLLYSVVIYPEEDGSWSKRIVEYEPGTFYSPSYIKAYGLEQILKAYYGIDVTDLESRIVKTYPNITGFFEDNNTYVAIDLALNDIGNPADVKIGLRTFAEKDGILISDVTPALDAPSRRLLVIPKWPTSLEVRAGETAEVRVPIHIFEASGPGNVTLQQLTKTDNYTLEFNPNRIDRPLNGTISSDLEITVEPHVEDKVLPVAVNITDSVILNPTGSSWNETFYVNVLPPLSELERLGSSFNEFLVGTFALYWIPFGISSVFGYWLSRRIDRGRLPKEFLEKLSTKDILAINASVVVGVLIFLSIGASNLLGAGALINVSILTASIVYPFAISAILTLVTGDHVYGIKFTIPGFVFLMVSVVLIAFLIGNPNPQNVSSLQG